MAGVAQLVEQLTCNQQVGGSNPFASSRGPDILQNSKNFNRFQGEVPERSKGTDCKSVGSAFGGSNPPLPTSLWVDWRRAGIAQLARASAFQAEGRGFESRFPLHSAIEKNEASRPRSSGGQSASLVRTRSPVQIRSWAPSWLEGRRLADVPNAFTWFNRNT